MASTYIHEWPNIFKPREDEFIHVTEAGQTLHEWMTANVTGYSQDLEKQPVCCLHQDKEVLPEDWTTFVLGADQHIVLAVRPYGWELAIAVVVGALAATVAISSMPPPPPQLNIPDASPTYDVNVRANRARMNEPIPFAVGRNRHYMDLLSQPLKLYEGNDQYLYLLFSLGWGEFDIEEFYIGKTETSAYKDIEIEVSAPSEPVTLFPDNVDNSEEVKDIELFGSNEEDYEGWTTPYIAVDKGEKAQYLAVDFVARQGIYGLNDEGGLYHRQADIDIQYRIIDENDAPTGEWETKSFSYREATTTPQRYSQRWKVTPGRYEVRAQRTNNAGKSTRTKDSIHWEGLRAFYAPKSSYEGITKIAVRIRASNNLSQEAENQFNVIATAKLPPIVGDTFGQPVATESIAWAFCEAIRSKHGGALPASMINIDNILSLHQAWESDGETISRVFDTRGTLLATLQEIVACGRGTVIPHDGQFFVVRDAAKIANRSLYTPFMMMDEPIVERTFFEPFENDSVTIEYFNKAIWEKDEILCQLPNRPANNPKRITLPGVTNHTQAWRIGITEAAKLMYRREQIRFTVGTEAMINHFGDRIGVNYWTSKQDSYGEIIAFDGLRLTLSTPHKLHESKQNYIILTRPDGTCTQSLAISDAGNNSVLIESELDFEPYIGDLQERTKYQIGTSETITRPFVISDIAPDGENTVAITAFWDNPEVYTFQNGTPPDPVTGGNPRDDVIPVISDLIIVQDVLDPQTAILSWRSTAGAREFVIDHSLDNAQWARVAVVTETVWQTKLYSGVNYFRVAGVGDAQGQYEYGSITLTGPDYDIPTATEISLTEPFTGSILKVEWEEVLSADHYEVEIIKNDETIYRVRNYKDTYFEYTAEQGVNHGSGRSFTVQVTARNAKGAYGAPATLDVSNPAPSAPDNVVIAPLIDGFIIFCDPSTESDLKDLRLFGSKTKGFTPSASTLLQISTTTRFDLNQKGAWYFKLAWSDVWDASDLNYSGEFSGSSDEVNVDFDFDKEIQEAFDKNFPDSFKEAFGESIEDVFPITGSQIKDGSIVSENMAANSIISELVASKSILADHIAFNQIDGNHVKTKSLTANNINVSTLSSLSANIGTITGGTFRTNAASSARVELSSVGDIPLFIGTGLKSMTTAKLAYNKATNELVFRGELNIKSASSGARIELDNKSFRVYDQNNRLRAELGELS
ncbi:hypothetical protein AB832_07315 [Flavobacteriaceae bacterium (ex Bugula neritina AB1)]|nr:hypothetical protein AB832_07315 [Flavobacteriaceae bacterium (ex Bugula neritina AB1)]